MKPVEPVAIRPYAKGDLTVLERTLGDPSQMIYLNGPESQGKLKERDAKYVALSETPERGCMYTIVVGENKTAAGNVGFWDTEWKGDIEWETGWFVIPGYQKKGIATAAMKILMEKVSKLDKRFMFAFPSIENYPSNAISRKLGFSLIDQVEIEYPPKSNLKLVSNVWRKDLKE